jgi:hypothetical protein
MTLPVWEFTIVRISLSFSPQERQVLLELSSTTAIFSARKNSTAASVPAESPALQSEHWARETSKIFGREDFRWGALPFCIVMHAWAGPGLIARA